MAATWNYGYPSVASLQAASVPAYIPGDQTAGYYGAPLVAIETAGYYAPGDGGAATYVRTSGSTPGGVQSADGQWWALSLPDGEVSLRQLGAHLDGVTLDDTAWSAAAALSQATGVAVLHPGGVSCISASLDFGSSGADNVTSNRLRGVGRNVSLVQMNTDNIPILKLGGAFANVHDIGFGYKNPQPNTATSARAVAFYALRWSVMERIKLWNAYEGLGLPQQAVYAGSNWISNSSIRDVYMEGLTGAPIEIQGYLGGCDGLFENIYCSNSGGALVSGYVFGAFTSLDIDNLHLENASVGEPFYVQTCDSVNLTSFHVEQLTLTTNYGGLIHADSNSHIIVNGAEVYGNSFLSGSLPNAYALVRLSVTSTCSLSNLREQHSTITCPSVTQTSLASGTVLYTQGLFCDAVTTVGYLVQPSAYRVRDGLYEPYGS